MVDKRKRAGSDAAASDHQSSDVSDDEQVGKDQPVTEETAQNKAFSSFSDGAELHKALQTPSADLLRLLLSRLRNQTNLSFAENTQRSTIPASDKRIQLVKDYCQLCETQASNSGTPTSAAASIFSTWELADRQDLPTLLHLPIFCLAQSLALLSIHYPTHALGANIIERILSSNEPWLGMLHNYISNLGGAKFASSKQRDGRTSKGSDVAALASLVLLREITTFAKGRYAGKLFDSFNWSMKVLPHIFNMRRRTNRKNKASKKSQAALDVSLRRPDIRTLYILFLLSFLQQSYSHTLKLRLLDLGRDFLPAILKGLPQDPPDVVQTILLHLHEDLVKDQKIPRSKKVEFWNEWACGCVVQLYSREEEHVLIHADTDAVENPSVAELAHHFLLSICTNPGFGICYPDRGWYPRKAAPKDDGASAVDQRQNDALLDGVDKHPFSTELSSTQKGKQSGGGGGPIYNKVLSGVLRQLAVAEDLRQQELALSILTACPELVGPYLESSCAGLSVDPRPSSRWLCNIAFFGRVVGLEFPSFRNAKVEHLESTDAFSAGALVPQSHKLFASEPPPMASILANILPAPLHRFLFSQGLNSTDRLVRYSTCALLCRCLERMVRFRNICQSAIDELDEDENGPWRRRLDALEMEARRRIPDVSIVIQILQVATSRSGVNGAPNGTEADDTGEAASAVSESDNMLSTEVALRLLSLYYQAVPSSAFDVRFNAGKLLTNAFITSSHSSAATQAADGDTEMANGHQSASANGANSEDGDETTSEDGEEDSGEITLEALCQVHTLRILSHSARAASFDWTVKPTGQGNLSYLGMLLTLYVSTPLDQVKAACEDLLRSLLAPSSFFEHYPAEIEAWLASLPHADTRAAINDNGNALVGSQLSEEQQSVVAFMDECMLRCAKTPYRYIESARQFLQEHGKGWDTNGNLGARMDVSSGDLLASPWLMSLFEQFTIRVEKGLFVDTATVDALTAFFARILPLLCAYTRQTSAIEAMASKVQNTVRGNAKYGSTAFLAATVVSKIRAIREAYDATEAESEPPRKGKQSSQNLFNDCLTAAELKAKLRSAERPLTQSQISDLYEAVKKLNDNGFPSVSQILEELDPLTENIGASVYPDADKIALGAIPVLNLPLAASFAPPESDDFMTTTDEVAAKDPNSLVPWKAKDQVRLAIWTAVVRSQGEQADEQLLPHASALLAVADASGQLEEEDVKHFLFAEAGSPLVSDTEVASKILLQISEMAVRYLDPQLRDHAAMAQAIVRKMEEGEEFEDDYFRCMIKLAPFMDEDSACETLGTALRVMEQAEPPAFISRLVAETLTVMAAVFGPGSRPWSVIANHLQGVIDRAPNSDSAWEEEETEEKKEEDGGDLYLGLIQAVLQQPAYVSRENLTSLDLSQLVSSASGSLAKDGALVAAIHAHPILAQSVSESILSLLSDPEGGDPQLLRDLPCTLLTLLSALLEIGTDSPAGQSWTENYITPFVSIGLDAVLYPSDIPSEAVDKHAALLVAALRCALTFGWEATQKAASYKLLTFAKDAVSTSPLTAFKTPLLQVLLGLVEEAPAFHKLSDILQASMDAGLLWLVRRFAEDSNDSEELVQTVSLFTSLIERITATTSVEVQLKKSLVDPVIQAAIKNRLRAPTQMQLVLTLCTHAELEPSHLSRYLGALSAHSDFNAVMRGSASVVHPLQADDVEDVEDTEEQRAKGAEELKQLLGELVYTVASKDPKGLLRAPLLTKLMSFYGASLSRFDRMLLGLFRKFEEECGQSFSSLVQGWTLPASQQGSVTSESTLEAMQSLDANGVFATCTEYPRSLSLRNTLASGYEESVDEDDEEGEGLPGQVYGRHSDAALRYDPVFLASLLAGVTAPEIKLSGLEWVSVFSTNVPGLVVMGLSSRCSDMRSASLTLLSSLYLAVREADFQERDHLLMVLDLLRDALDSSTLPSDSPSSTAPFLPATTTLFIAHALRSVVTPSSFLYPIISHFLLARPELDISDVPLLYNLLYTSSDRYKQERMWMLRFLRDCARSGGRAEWTVFKRRRTWELLASLYDSCDGSAGGGSERAVEEAAIRALVEDTLAWLVRNGDVGIELWTRRGLGSWVWMQVVKEGVVALAGMQGGEGMEGRERGEVEGRQPAMAAPRSVWLLLVAQLVRSVDLNRLHRATEGAWIASIATLVQTTVKALHNCHTSRSSALPNVSIDLVRTISYAAALTLDKLVTFAAEDSDLALHAATLVDTLGLLLDLATDTLNAAGKEGKGRKEAERTCVRIQRSLLTLAPTAAEPKIQQKLAKLIRRSTSLCRPFDSETSSLVISNLFTSSS